MACASRKELLRYLYFKRDCAYHWTTSLCHFSEAKANMSTERIHTVVLPLVLTIDTGQTLCDFVLSNVTR